MAEAEIEKMGAENNRLRGLLWYAWAEMNSIRARSGVPLDEHGSPQPINEQYWSNLVEAMSVTLGEDAKPWPSPQARLLTDELSRGEQE